MAGQGSRWTVANVSSTAVFVITMIASFFLTGEGTYPGQFFVERQALWNDGTYGVKLTFLLTWFTLMAAVALPLVTLFGVVVLARRLAAGRAPVPSGWDVRQVGRRLLTASGAIVLLAVWTGVTGVVAFAPEWLSPLGGFASLFLILLPALPLVPTLLFEALIPPSYVEGPIEGMQFSTYRDRRLLDLHVAGRRYRMSASSIEGLGLGQGIRVQLVASGFLKRVQRIAHAG